MLVPLGALTAVVANCATGTLAAQCSQYMHVKEGLPWPSLSGVASCCTLFIELDTQQQLPCLRHTHMLEYKVSADSGTHCGL